MRARVVTLSERRRSTQALMTAISTTRPVTQLTWRTLLRLAAAGQAVGLGGAAAALGDAEAGVIAVVTLAALLLQRFRATTGAVLLGLLFADTAFFTGAAAVSNLLDRATPTATIGPAVLAAIALTGLFAAVAIVSRRAKTAEPARAATPIAFAMLAALAVVAVASLVSSRGVAGSGSDVLARPAPGPAPARIKLDIKGARYSTDALSATGPTITVAVTNHDLFWHTFTIAELGIDLRVPVGDEKAVTFRAPPGSYTYICGVPGHASFMRGVLTVR